MAKWDRFFCSNAAFSKSVLLVESHAGAAASGILPFTHMPPDESGYKNESVCCLFCIEEHVLRPCNRVSTFLLLVPKSVNSLIILCFPPTVPQAGRSVGGDGLELPIDQATG